MATETEEVVTTETREYHVCDFCGQRTSGEPLLLALSPTISLRKQYQAEGQALEGVRPDARRMVPQRTAIQRATEKVKITTRKEMDLCRLCVRSLFGVDP